MNDKPELAPDALRLAQVSPYLEGGEKAQWIMDAAAELRRLFELAHEQHAVIYGLRVQVRNLEHNNSILKNALWAASQESFK